MMKTVAQKGNQMLINLKPIGKGNMLFRRSTNRYAKKGTISNNTGYLSVARDMTTGQFVSRNSLMAKFAALFR